ncbi:MAG: hypothetical protein QNL91_08390 [Candidatus Krumholzibacteria bacterium]|nr:hypothetical protein [Candidatus Krumholzibacteria bacterium]
MRHTTKYGRRSGRQISVLMTMLLLGLLTLGGCGSDDDPADPGGGGGGGIGGTVTATVNGESFSAAVVQGVRNGGIIGVGSSNVGAELAIGFGWLDTGEPSYTISVGSAANGTVIKAGGGTWQASGDQGSGTIFVETLTATRVAGTFSFTAVVVGTTGSPATMNVTNGTFDAELAPPAVP